MLRGGVVRALTLPRHCCAATPVVQQKRHEYLLKRMHPPKLGVEGEQRLIKPEGVPHVTTGDIDWVHVWARDYFQFTNKGDEFVYIEQKNTDNDPVGDVNVLLCWDIEGLGLAGDVVQVNKDLARHKLVPLGAALYDTPENVKKVAKIAKKTVARRKKMGDTSVPEVYDRLIQMLHDMTLPIPMNLEGDWTLDARHVRIAFRQQGVILEEKNIYVPKGITDEQELEVVVTLPNNGGRVHAKIPVKALIVDRMSPAARQTPFANTFTYTPKTIEDCILESYYALYPNKAPRIDSTFQGSS